jgi:hypothetical protein
MNKRATLTAALRQAHKDLEANKDAYDAYVRARMAANSAFCELANRFGVQAALDARPEEQSPEL